MEASVAAKALISRGVSTPRAPDPYKGMISLGADRVNLGRNRKNDIRYIFRSKFILMVRLSHFMNNPLKQLDSNEADLISRVCNGEHKAFEELVRPYERLVYVTAISVLRNAADAEEVAQEAVLKAFSKLSSFRAECKFSTWLVQITYNEARMKLRKDRRHLYESVDDPRQDKEGDYWPKDFADWRPIPSELLESEQVRKALQNAINSLNDMYREVVNLRDIQNLSIKDTATVLGIPETSVKTRLRRARLLLRDALAPGIDGLWHTGHPYQKVRPW